MKALIAFIGMAVVILTLIEINERIKKRKNTDAPTYKGSEDCAETACTDCSLLDICDKEEKKTTRKK